MKPTIERETVAVSGRSRAGGHIEHHEHFTPARPSPIRAACCQRQKEQADQHQSTRGTRNRQPTDDHDDDDRQCQPEGEEQQRNRVKAQEHREIGYMRW